AVRAWIAAVPPDMPVAVAIARSGEGELPLATIGLAWREGEGRAAPAAYIEALRPWFENPACPKITCDIKSAILALDAMGVTARGFDHDVMLYAFLLDADPSGCPLDDQARRRLDLKLGPVPEQHADITLELWRQLSAAVDGRGLRR